MNFEYYTEPDEVYYAKSRKYLSSHMLMEFIASPHQFNRIMTGAARPRKDNDNFSFGTAFHMAVLQPEEFTKTYITDTDSPVNPTTGKPYGRDTKKFSEWLATLPKGKRILTAEEFEQIEEMKAGIWRNQEAIEFFETPYHAEHIIRQDMFGVPCQCELDYLSMDINKPTEMDVKTTSKIDKFHYDIEEYMYLYQRAFYTMMVNTAYGVNPSSFMIAFDKQEPWDCKVVGVTADTLGTFINGGIYKKKTIEGVVKLIERIKQCRESGIWPTGMEGTEWI